MQIRSTGRQFQHVDRRRQEHGRLWLSAAYLTPELQPWMQNVCRRLWSFEPCDEGVAYRRGLVGVTSAWRYALDVSPPEITAPSRIWYEYGLVPVFQIFSMRVIWTIYIIIIIFRWVTHRIGVRIPRWSDQRLTETFSCATVRLYWLECRTTFRVSRSKVNATKSCKAPTKMTKGRT